MLALVEAAGWPIWFLIIASVVALAIIGERLWSLRAGIVMPRNLLTQTINEFRQHGVTAQLLSRLANGSPLGQVFAAGLRNVKSSPAIMKEAIEESGRTVAIELERFLTSLGTVAVIAPLLGLFGGQARFQQLTGQQTQVGHALFGWGQSSFDQVLPRLGAAPMIALVEGPITPLAIAQGRGDEYLFALNSSLSRWARPAWCATVIPAGPRCACAW